MNENKTDTRYNETVKELFQDVSLEAPSADFTSHIMARVEREAARKKKQQQWTTIASIASGILAILIIPAIAFHFLGLKMPHLSMLTGNIRIDPILGGMALVVLLLLIGDTLLRQHIRRKQES